MTKQRMKKSVGFDGCFACMHDGPPRQKRPAKTEATATSQQKPVWPLHRNIKDHHLRLHISGNAPFMAYDSYSLPLCAIGLVHPWQLGENRTLFRYQRNVKYGRHQEIRSTRLIIVAWFLRGWSRLPVHKQNPHLILFVVIHPSCHSKRRLF